MEAQSQADEAENFQCWRLAAWCQRRAGKEGGAGVSPEASVPPPPPSSAPPGPASPSVLFDFSSAAFTCIIHHQNGPRNAACWVSRAKGRPRKPPDMQRGKSMTPPGWGQPWTPRAHGSSGVGIRVHRVFQLGGSPLCDPGESLNLSVRHQPYCYFDSLPRCLTQRVLG